MKLNEIKDRFFFYLKKGPKKPVFYFDRRFLFFVFLRFSYVFNIIIFCFITLFIQNILLISYNYIPSKFKTTQFSSKYVFTKLQNMELLFFVHFQWNWISLCIWNTFRSRCLVWSGDNVTQELLITTVLTLYLFHVFGTFLVKISGKQTKTVIFPPSISKVLL